MAIPDITATRPEKQSKEEHHQGLLKSYHMTWVTLERDGFPPTILRCYIASLKLAIQTLTTVEEELKVLLEMAYQKLREIETIDRAVEHFEQTIGRK